jgi:acyl carrier protein
MNKTNERLRAIIAEKLERDPTELRAEMSFVHDLGADSLDTIEIMMALEEEFQIEIPDDDVEAMRTIGDAEAFLATIL